MAKNLKSRCRKVSVDLEKLDTKKISESHDQHMKECDLDLKDVASTKKCAPPKNTVDLKNSPLDLKSKNRCPTFRKFSILVLKKLALGKKAWRKNLGLKSDPDQKLPKHQSQPQHPLT